MTKELEETKAAGEEVAKWLRDEAKNAEVLADHFHGTSEEDRFREDFARYSAMAATVRTLLSALSRGACVKRLESTPYVV